MTRRQSKPLAVRSNQSTPRSLDTDAPDDDVASARSSSVETEILETGQSNSRGTGPVGITDHVQADNANDVSAGEARDAANAVVAELENDNSGPAPTVLDLDDLVRVWTLPEEPVVWSMAFDHMELPSTESAAPVQAALDPASILHLEPDPDFDWTEELDLNLDLGEDIVVSAEEDISGNAPGSSTSGVGGDESASVFVPEVDHADLSTGKKRKRAERVHTGRKRQRRK